jgi:hypothetical protein
MGVGVGLFTVVSVDLLYRLAKDDSGPTLEGDEK